MDIIRYNVQWSSKYLTIDLSEIYRIGGILHTFLNKTYDCYGTT